VALFVHCGVEVTEVGFVQFSGLLKAGHAAHPRWLALTASTLRHVSVVYLEEHPMKKPAPR
jgi:hypothetical protein